MLHLTEEQRGEIFTKFNEITKHLGDIKAALNSKKPYEDTGFNIHEVHAKIDEYKAQVNKILSTPPPTANTSNSGEKKSEDKKDVDMKAEDGADKK